MNEIYCGNNLDVMTKEISKKSIDLIYLDPPFFGTGKQYQNIWNNKNEVGQYKERTELGIEGYINWIEPRLYRMKELLKSTGSIYLHCDYHNNTQMRILMDEIFNINNFRNEIIWSYTGRENPKQRMFPRKHNNILFYTKSNKYTFNMQFKPYNEEYIKFFRYDDDDGKGKYQKQPNNNGGKYKQYLNDTKGHPINSVWNDIKSLNNFSAEWMEYKTQKPEALIERIIKSSSNPNDIILDPFMGGGTTLAAAKKLDRQFIGIDIAEEACNLTAKRIEYPKTNIINTIKIVPDFDIMETYEFQEYVCNIFNAMNTSADPTRPSGPDGGIDGRFIGEFKGWGLSVTVSKLKGTEIKECIADMVNKGYENAQLISAKPISKANEMIAQSYMKDSKLNKLELHYIGDLI